MQLSADQFEQIVTQLRSGQPHRNAERRASPRVGLRAQVSVIPCRTGIRARVHTVWIRDVSAHGINFLFHQPLAAGTYVVLVLPRTKGPTLDLLFVVKRCQPLGNGQVSVGAHLERVIESSEAKAKSA